MFDLLKKKKATPEGLEKARQMNLITELESLELQKARIEEKIKKEKEGGKKKI